MNKIGEETDHVFTLAIDVLHDWQTAGYWLDILNRDSLYLA